MVTTQKQGDNFDLQISRIFFACNISFSSVEHKECKNLIQILRSGYLPLNRYRLSNALLDEVHNNVIYECKEMFKNQIVSIVLDGWTMDIQFWGKPLILAVMHILHNIY